MMNKVKVRMEIWDNDNTTEDKQEILLYCERALNKVLDYSNTPLLQYKITERWWGGWTAEIHFSEYIPILSLLRRYNDKLNRLHYWTRSDEPMVMYWDWDWE